MDAIASGKHEGAQRAFTHTTAAWYGKTAILGDKAIDEVMVGMYHPDGGTSGEFSVRWYELCHKLTPKLEVFDDAWDALTHFPDVLEAMAAVDGKDISPADFCALLLQFGIVDKTDRKGPGKPVKPSKEEVYEAALKLIIETAANAPGREACAKIATEALAAAEAA